MIKNFIKDGSLLDESYQVADLFDFSKEVNALYSKLNTFKKPSLVGLVGKFGSGKSTMLYRLKNEKLSDATWIHFDAWKYPDRKDLWEGFVLDFTRTISPKDFEKIRKRIDGTQNDDKKTLINTVADYAALIPGLAVIKNLNHFFETSPARRVFEIQEILNEQLKKHNKDIYIVIEDIDRSGDSGVFFLETLNHFFKTHQSKNKLIAIIPLGTEKYSEHIESYLKCLDFVEFFQPNHLNGLKNFIDQVVGFDDETEGGFVNGSRKKYGEFIRNQVFTFFRELFLKNPSMTVRKMKLILRKAKTSFLHQVAMGYEPDFRVTLCVEATRFFQNDRNLIYFNLFTSHRAILQDNIYALFLEVITNEIDGLYKNNIDFEIRDLPRLAFKFIKRPDNLASSIEKYPSKPWYYEPFIPSADQPSYMICDFYFNE